MQLHHEWFAKYTGADDINFILVNRAHVHHPVAIHAH